MAGPQNNIQIRKNNIRTLYRAIRDNGPISKRDLQEVTGLSWGAVSSLTGVLSEEGYVVLAGKQVTNVGRRPTEVDVNPSDHLIAGVDLNLDCMYGIVTDVRGRVLKKWNRTFERRDYDCVIGTVFALLDEIFNIYGRQVMGIGLAVSGFVDAENGVSTALPYIAGWSNVPLKRMLEERYGRCTVIMHDPNCIMEAEKAFGDSGLNTDGDAVLIRMDGGIGMSLMTNRRIYTGANGRAGELGHVLVNPDGPKCECGNIGCLHEYATIGGIIRRFSERYASGEKTLVTLTSDETENFNRITLAANAGDALCAGLFREMGTYLGRALSTLFNVLNPVVIVLYGQMPKYIELFRDSMTAELASHVNDGIPYKIAVSVLDETAAARGAAFIASEQAIRSLNLLGDDA